MLDRTGIEGASSPRWMVVATHAHREQIAVENLKRQDFQAYAPSLRRQIRHARRTLEVLRPLFPGYIFVAHPVGELRWRPILSTLGVRTLVRNGDEPATLPNSFIETLRSREIDGVIVRPPSPYEPGQEVRVLGGPLDGLVAEVIAMEEKDRIVVLMNLLNRPTRVRLDLRAVAPA